ISSGEYSSRGFKEKEISRQTIEFGGIAHVFSSYRSLHADGSGEFYRGVNSIQLVNHYDRWWILTLIWEDESESNPLPERFDKS
ncbi:MAG: hypothetical protein V3T31_05360, partial [candidate division Zixibacteria bacterium]